MFTLKDFDLFNGNYMSDYMTVNGFETMVMNDYSPISDKRFSEIVAHFEHIVDNGHNPNDYIDNILEDHGVKETNFTQKQIAYLNWYITELYEKHHQAR